LDIVGGPLDKHTQRPDDAQGGGTVEQHGAAQPPPFNAGDVKAAPLQLPIQSNRIQSNRNTIDSEAKQCKDKMK